MIEIYVDGSCSSNGTEDARGGFGVVAIDVSQDKKIYEAFGILIPGEENATNNRAELKAIVAALQWIETQDYDNYTIYSDSAYCVNMINQWMKNWKANNWIVPSTKTLPANFDLIKELDERLAFSTNISVQKVKGHAGVEWNEYADKLAVKGTEKAKEYQL